MDSIIEKYQTFGSGQLYLTTLTPFSNEDANELKLKFENEFNNYQIVINNEPITYNYYMKLCTHQHDETFINIDDDLNLKTKKELDAIISDLSLKRNYNIDKGINVGHSRSIIRLENKYPYYYKPKFALYPTYSKSLLLKCNLQSMKIVAKQFNIEWMKNIPIVKSNHRIKLINELIILNKITE
jgi:hypothetical protein